MEQARSTREGTCLPPALTIPALPEELQAVTLLSPTCLPTLGRGL